jgi:membrane protease YdiL (CAAX protease family)
MSGEDQGRPPEQPGDIASPPPGEPSAAPPAASIPEEQDGLTSFPPPAPPIPDPGSPAPGREPEAFWRYTDVLVFAGLSVPAMLAGVGLVKALIVLFQLHISRAAEAIAMQFAGYAFVFLVLLLILRVQYDRPFWRSLAWRPIPLAPVWVFLAGWLTAFAVAGAAALIRTPNTSNPLTELMPDRASMILIGIFGVTLGPIAEELIFRGFLQPLLVRSLGALPGILLAAVPFGLLHFSEYGNSWRHVVLICLAGAAFGWMRHAARSTKASTLMHAAYNLLFFVVLLGQK